MTLGRSACGGHMVSLTLVGDNKRFGANRAAGGEQRAAGAARVVGVATTCPACNYVVIITRPVKMV